MIGNGVLPDNGPAQIAQVALPAGQRVYGEDETKVLAWVTSEPMAGADQAWLALSGAQAETGLAPVLLPHVEYEGTDGSMPLDGWDFGFGWAKDVMLLDVMSAVDVLAENWFGRGETSAPFGHAFPGLAPAGDRQFPLATLRGAVAVVASEQPVHLGLVAAHRSADVPAAVGWDGNGDGPGTSARSLQISAVLRSWEDRFGARLLTIGIDDELRVLVERPPATSRAALLVAAEHVAFASEWGDYAHQPVSELAPLLMGRPVWRFWWD